MSNLRKARCSARIGISKPPLVSGSGSTHGMPGDVGAPQRTKTKRPRLQRLVPGSFPTLGLEGGTEEAPAASGPSARKWRDTRMSRGRTVHVSELLIVSRVQLSHAPDPRAHLDPLPLPSPRSVLHPNPRARSTMPRKAAASSESAAPPRRSSRIKDQPKPEAPPPKAPAKPRTKKVKEPAAEGEEKPKATKGRKRTATEKDAEDGEPAANGDEPPAKKVRLPVLLHPCRLCC